ncbi:MAG: endonuclease/exonuclease/phosphatase family protein [Deltaproteobacteria bacterium]|nr:endonuclease/exonuclease/phosphatase family protein [Deltaproteobacteria bacterium]
MMSRPIVQTMQVTGNQGATLQSFKNTATIGAGSVSQLPLDVAVRGIRAGFERIAAGLAQRPLPVVARPQPGRAAVAGQIHEEKKTVSNPAARTCQASSPPVGPGDNGGKAAKPTPVSIADIRGRGYNSPMTNKSVQTKPVIVTAVSKWGMWVQDINAQTDPDCSSGIFVYTQGQPDVHIGDRIVIVQARVVLFPSDQLTKANPQAKGQAGKAQLGFARWVVQRIGHKLPPAVLIGKGGRMPPAKIMKSRATGSDIHNPKTPFNPAKDAMAFYTSLRDMRVKIANPVVVGPVSYGRVSVAIDNGEGIANRTLAGGVLLTPDGPNTQVITLDLSGLPKDTLSSLAMGDRILGEVEGVLDYSFGEFRLRVTKEFKVEKVPQTRPSVPDLPKGKNIMRVMQANLENMNFKDAERMEHFAEMIAQAAPDMCSFQEVQSDYDFDPDGVMESEKTMNLLSKMVYEKTGIRYQWAYVPPEDSQDGGKKGGNIRNVFFYNPARFRVRMRQGDATDKSVLVRRGKKLFLTKNTSRIEPKDEAYAHSRKPVVFEYDFIVTDQKGRKTYQRFLHVNIHSISKRGEDGAWGRQQPPVYRSETKRKKQHKPIVDFIRGALNLDADQNIILSGDGNAYPWEESVRLFTDAGMHHLAEEQLPPGDVYSYYFNGGFFLYDYLMASPALANRAKVAIWHRHSLFSPQDSDHDVVLAAIDFNEG